MLVLPNIHNMWYMEIEGNARCRVSDKVCDMPVPQKLNTKKALQAKLAGQSYQQIADAQGVHKATVHRHLLPILMKMPNAQEMAEVKQRAADLCAYQADRIIANISDEDVANASLQQKATSAAILIDKSRLISGESTANIAILVSSAVRESGVEMTGVGVDDEV